MVAITGRVEKNNKEINERSAEEVEWCTFYLSEENNNCDIEITLSDTAIKDTVRRGGLRVEVTRQQNKVHRIKGQDKATQRYHRTDQAPTRSPPNTKKGTWELVHFGALPPGSRV